VGCDVSLAYTKCKVSRMRFITKAKTAFAATRNMSSKPNMSQNKTFFTAEDAEDAEEKHEGFPLHPPRPLR
ncbi:MAG: hypothetical protein WC091_08940, partial [Sulfuricellaceae bacterium]